MQILTILIQSITQHSQMKTEVKIFSIQWFSFYASIRIEKKTRHKSHHTEENWSVFHLYFS